MDIQLWSADCHLVKGEELVPGQLSIGSESIVFKAQRNRFLGLGGLSYSELWRIGIFEVDFVRLERDEISIEGKGIRVRFRFQHGAARAAHSGLSYALDVSKRKAKEGEFSMRKLMHNYMNEIDHSKEY